MNPTPAQRRWLAIGGTAAVFAAILVGLSQQGSDRDGVQAALEDKEKGVKAPGKSKDSWPLFGGDVSRNLVNLIDKDVPTAWNVNDEPGKGKIKWRAQAGTKAYGGPVISGGKIFVGTNNGNPRNKRDAADNGLGDVEPLDMGVVMCFDEKTGEFVWQAVFPKLPAGRVNDWPEEGICSSPVVEGDRLWFVNNRCEVVCASTKGFEKGKTEPTMPTATDKTDAGILWRVNMIKDYKVFPHNLSTCSPLLVGDTLFVITSNGVDEDHINIPSPEAPSFLALDKETGKLKWKSNLPSVGLIEARKTDPKADIKQLVNLGKVLMHGQWSNPVYAEPNGQPQIIFPGGDGWMYGFNPANGELIWKFDCNPKDAVYTLGVRGTRNDFVCTPVVWENKLYIGVGQDPEHNKGVGHLWCIDIAKKPANREKDLSPAFKVEKGPGGEEVRKTIFDPKDPSNKDSGLVWHYGGFRPNPKPGERLWYYGRTLSTCCVHDGLCYAGEYDGWVHCLDARTGEVYWEHNMHSDTWSSPYWVDGKVYIGNEKGEVLIFQHGKEKKLLNTVKVGGFVRATPVVCNGTLYLSTENPTFLYAIRP